VSYKHPGHIIASRISLDVPAGSTAVITGPNGSGKSTLMYLCAGLIPPQAGTVAMAGRRADPNHPSEFVRRGVRRGVLFQEGGLLSNMNSISNVALPLRYHADVLGLSGAEIDRRARAALNRVRLAEADVYAVPAHLSYGERKRVALARALAMDPNFYFFDDPLVGLDAETARLVETIVLECKAKPGITTVIATSNDALAAQVGGARYLLLHGALTPQTDAA
jgi:phospholipid/cholesterol/gamma-HCH transport system ATP-binding protein